MLTYDLSNVPKGTLYEHLYQYIRDDITRGVLTAGEKLPSKRTLAKNLGVSTITVESAYAQLISEGYVTSQPKRGYYVAHLVAGPKPTVAKKPAAIQTPAPPPSYRIDFSRNQTNPSQFPFATWKKLLRDTISQNSHALMEKSPSGGVPALKRAIAAHLAAFRGLSVEPDQIIVGAGTEYLYGLLIQLCGREKIYCVENPGYRKIAQVYQAQGVSCRAVEMDTFGVSIQSLRQAGGDIAHIGPTHQFPTGITMPVSRRYELLAWANEAADRLIIEDDYDSEFRLHGRPIPALASLDAQGRVIYMNTFSKSLAPTIRISYMVLPTGLANEFYDRLSFYSCTVSNFEQFTLARFISDGHFEKHINRMRLYYAKKRQAVLAAINQSPLAARAEIIEEDSGLHFLLRLETKKDDRALTDALAAQGIHFSALSEYYLAKAPANTHRFLLSYANLDDALLPDALEVVANCL